jgi:hypothetical protein
VGNPSPAKIRPGPRTEEERSREEAARSVRLDWRQRSLSASEHGNPEIPPKARKLKVASAVFSKEEEERPAMPLAAFGSLATSIFAQASMGCPCPSRVAPLLRKKGTKKAAIAETSCRRFTCPVCFYRRSSLWLQSIACHLRKETDIFAFIVGYEDFQKAKHSIQRRQGAFVRVNFADGVLIVTNKPTKYQDLPEDAEIALELLSFAMTQIVPKTRKLSIRASRAWELANKRESQLNKVGLIQKNGFQEAIQALVADLIEPKIIHTREGKLAKFEFEGWSEQEIDAKMWELMGKSGNYQTSEQATG